MKLTTKTQANATSSSRSEKCAFFSRRGAERKVWARAAFSGVLSTPAACSHTRSKAVGLLGRHWPLSPQCTQDIFVSIPGWMVILCQRRGKGGECRRSRGDSQVALTPSLFLSLVFFLCWTNISTLWHVCQCGSPHPPGHFLSIQEALIIKRGGGGGWDGRKEGQTNTLGSTLFVVLFHRATQEKTKHKRSSAASPNPSPREAANTQIPAATSSLAVCQRHPPLCLMTVETQRECVSVCVLVICYTQSTNKQRGDI